MARKPQAAAGAGENGSLALKSPILASFLNMDRCRRFPWSGWQIMSPAGRFAILVPAIGRQYVEVHGVMNIRATAAYLEAATSVDRGFRSDAISVASHSRTGLLSINSRTSAA